MGFAVPAAASFPGSAEREGRRRQGCAGGWEPARRKNSWHRTPPESKGASTERTVPTPTSICLIHVHALTHPMAPSEPHRLSQEMPMVWKGTLNGLWMNVFLHHWSWFLYDCLLPQEATGSPRLWLQGGSLSLPHCCPAAIAALIDMRRSYFHCSSWGWSPWPVASISLVLWPLHVYGDPSCPFGLWRGACSPTCHWWHSKTGFGIHERSFLILKMLDEIKPNIIYMAT